MAAPCHSAAPFLLCRQPTLFFLFDLVSFFWFPLVRLTQKHFFMKLAASDPVAAFSFIS